MWKIVLRVLVLMALGCMAASWYAQEKYSNESLLSRYTLSPNLEEIRNSVANKNILDGVNAFEAGSYALSDSLLLDLLPDDSDFIYGEYLLGHSYLQHDRISNAILSFESVRDFGPSPVQEEAEWMTIIALIRRGRMEEAESLMTDLSNQGAKKYASAATNLQKDLQSNWRKLVFLK